MRCTVARPTPVPGKSLDRVQALEGDEELVGVGHVEARSVVPHKEGRGRGGRGGGRAWRPPGVAGQSELNDGRIPPIGVFPGVLQEIGEDGFEQAGVAVGLEARG